MKTLNANIEFIPAFGFLIGYDDTTEPHHSGTYKVKTLFIAVPFVLIAIEYARLLD